MRSTRKTLAQRKFAQSGLNHEKREATPAKTPDKTPISPSCSLVTQLPMCAKSLLDNVSLQSTHGHTIPEAVVVLERLETQEPPVTEPIPMANITPLTCSLRKRSSNVKKACDSSKRNKNNNSIAASDSQDEDQPLLGFLGHVPLTAKSDERGYYDSNKISEWISNGSADEEMVTEEVNLETSEELTRTKSPECRPVVETQEIAQREQDVYDFVEDQPVQTLTPSYRDRNKRVYGVLNSTKLIECYANNGIPHVKLSSLQTISSNEAIHRPYLTMVADVQQLINQRLQSILANQCTPNIVPEEPEEPNSYDCTPNILPEVPQKPLSYDCTPDIVPEEHQEPTSYNCTPNIVLEENQEPLSYDCTPNVVPEEHQEPTSYNCTPDIVPKEPIKSTSNDYTTNIEPVEYLEPTSSQGEDDHHEVPQLVVTINTNNSQETSDPPRTRRSKSMRHSNIVDAPVFRPTAEDFSDPMKYIDKIMPLASEYGLCKIVPPEDFKPECEMDENVRFTPTCQYPGKMFNRWGPVTRETCAIRAHLEAQNINVNRKPKLAGLEIDLPKLYHTVQNMGGLEQVLKKHKFNKVAEEMNYHNVPHAANRLEQAYVKYLLPYDTMTPRERTELLCSLDEEWEVYYNMLLKRAQNPLWKQERLLRGESSDDEDDDYKQFRSAILDADECVVKDQPMSMTRFEKIAHDAMEIIFGPGARPSPEKIEADYWKLVETGKAHVTVYSAAIDTQENNLGFTRDQTKQYGKHPWNLKVLGSQSASVLSSLGPAVGVTVPMLHLGMVFSTWCWHRDPVGLPWIDWAHRGAPKVWYGVGAAAAPELRAAIAALSPAVVQRKGVWLPSDTVAPPPYMLASRGARLSTLTQRPGEFVLVTAAALAATSTAGLHVAESVYVATGQWLSPALDYFTEAKQSCEPTTFAFERLLVKMADDNTLNPELLPTVYQHLHTIIHKELNDRGKLICNNFKISLLETSVSNVVEECNMCMCTLFMSRVYLSPPSPVCLSDALRLIEAQRSTRSHSHTVHVTYTDEQLQEMLQRLQKKIV